MNWNVVLSALELEYFELVVMMMDHHMRNDFLNNLSIVDFVDSIEKDRKKRLLNFVLSQFSI